MSIIPELASSQGRRDEEPNKILGARLVEKEDRQGIQEAADNLSNDDRNIQIDCLAVLEQVGILAPELIQDYLEDFFRLAFGKDNRLVWAAMINIALIADQKPDQVMQRFDQLRQVTEKGSVITQDNGIKILARAGGNKPEYNQRVFPFLMKRLQDCRPKSVPQYAESILPAVRPENQEQYLKVLNDRLDDLSSAQMKRVKKIFREFE